jgi:hypothetical protein
MKLFKVQHKGVKSARYFSKKKEAKAYRDEVPGDAVVNRGPDHWRGETFT